MLKYSLWKKKSVVSEHRVFSSGAHYSVQEDHKVLKCCCLSARGTNERPLGAGILQTEPWWRRGGEHCIWHEHWSRPHYLPQYRRSVTRYTSLLQVCNKCFTILRSSDTQRRLLFGFMGYSLRCTVMWWLASMPHRRRAPGSVLRLVPFCVEFACSPHVCVGTLWVLQFPPTSRIRLINESKMDHNDCGECKCRCLFVSMWPFDGLENCPPPLIQSQLRWVPSHWVKYVYRKVNEYWILPLQ